jgi:hypothetical protein
MFDTKADPRRGALNRTTSFTGHLVEVPVPIVVALVPVPVPMPVYKHGDRVRQRG